MRLLLTGLLALLVSPVIAEEVDSNQTFRKTYQAMHKIDHPWEIGTSVFTVSTKCHATEQEARDAIAAKVAAIKAIIEAKAKSLELGEPSDTWGTKLDAKANVFGSSPIQNKLFEKENVFRWVNICTGVPSDTPVRAKNVYSGSKTISVWFPNEKQHLEQLSAMVTDIENTSDKKVTVVCNSRGGGNFDLGVTEKSEKSIWEKIEAVARERAEAKVAKDFQTNAYQQKWAQTIERPFRRNGTSQLPRPMVVKESGQWVAKFSNLKSYSIYYKQSSKGGLEKGEISGVKPYNVESSSQTSEGLYGVLNINITKGCVDSKGAAEDAVSEIGSAIAEKLRKINDGRSSETEQLQLRNAFGQEYNPAQAYNQMEGTKRVQYYFNSCDLKDLYKTQEVPKLKAFRGQLNHTIVSANLDALKALQEELQKEHKHEIADPANLNVSASLSFSAKLSVLEAQAAELEAKADRALLESKDYFRCDAGNFSFACLVGEGSGGAIRSQRSLESAMDKAAVGYSQGVRSNIDASERGMRSFQGSYRIEYVLRRVIQDHKE